MGDPWKLLRAGNAKKGFALIKRRHAKEGTPSDIISLGAAYLWLGEYQSAWDHFHAANQAYPRQLSDFYGMAGVAKWCLGDHTEAVRQWRTGLDAHYADANGLGIKLPLLLFFASVVQSNVIKRSLVEELLVKKTKDTRSYEWPGAIARCIVGLTNESDLLSQCEVKDKSEAGDRKWLFGFYTALFALHRGDRTAFSSAMRNLSDTSGPDWSDHDFFLFRMWGGEFFLARHEASLPHD